MKCPWCFNINFLTRSTCAHCGEELFPPEPEEQPARHEKPPTDDERSGVIALCKSLAVSVAVLAVMAIGGIGAFDNWPVSASSQSPTLTPTSAPGVQSPTTSTDPAGQLAAMNSLLQAMTATRAELPETIGTCANISSDASTLQQVVGERTQHLTDAQNLSTDAMADGGTLKQALIQMAQTTLTADQSYLSWAQNAVSSDDCTDVSQNGDIGNDNQAAADAKRAFVKLWNPDAEEFSQPTYQWSDF